MTKFNQLVEARLVEGVTLNEIAAELGQTPTAITHRLQRGYGMSFSQYLGRLRVEKAKELLRRTQLPVSAIAQRVGLSDVSNFGKLFRKFEGMAPLDYRQRFGSNP
jgi:two-component system response regulator YesN